MKELCLVLTGRISSLGGLLRVILSQQPGELARPYSICDATVYFPGYYTNIYKNVQIFPGITSLQNVFLIPLPESQQNERLTIVYDASPHSLYEEGAE